MAGRRVRLESTRRFQCEEELYLLPFAEWLYLGFPIALSIRLIWSLQLVFVEGGQAWDKQGCKPTIGSEHLNDTYLFILCY